MLSHRESLDKYHTLKLRTLTTELPPYCKDFFRGIEPRTLPLTRIAYAYDLKVFFQFLLDSNPSFKKTAPSIREITLEMLDALTVSDIEEYMDYLKYRQNEEKEIINQERAIKRKVASLKSFYKYFYEKEGLSSNPLARVPLPKLHEKEIVRMEIDEVADFLDTVEQGIQLTKRQQAYHEKTKIRDLALLTLMLGTGIRVSECVGLNLEDVDFKTGGIKILRKGAKEQRVYFGDEVEESLLEYMKERREIQPRPGHEGALFLSLQNRRISVRSVENLVKKYAKIATPLKKITPHKLRSTYGTSLYRETDDIYLVADVLGHSDVNTTRKHYATLEEDRRRRARNAVKLREKQ